MRHMLALVGILLSLPAGAMAQRAPDLRSAAAFAVLGGSAVTSSGDSRIAGNAGVSPSHTVSGFPPATVRLGAIYLDEAIARQAQRDLAAASAEVAAATCTATSIGSRVTPGVHCLDTLELEGTLILDAGDDADAVWIFRIATSLVARPESKVLVLGAGDVYWQAGTVTIGARAAFTGSILARGDVTIGPSASITGRALTQQGVVTLDSSNINACCKPLTHVSALLPRGTECSTYSATLAASGGMAPYTFALSSGALPPGLTLSPAGTIAGRPTAGGRATFTVTATDANGCPGTAEYTIDIASCGSTAIALSPMRLDGGTVGDEYRQSITATGGIAPYTFSVTCGTLPPGLQLSTAGVLSGVLRTEGSFTFTVTATDAAGATGCRTYTVRICPAITIGPPVLPDGEVGTPYCLPLTASGGTAPYTFTVPAGRLPPGIAPSLCGTPTQRGDFTFLITVTDANGCTATASRRIHIEPKAEPPCIIRLEPADLPDGIVGTAYSVRIAATGCEPHTFSIAGSLPPGISGPSADGTLSGVPTTPGTYDFTITVTGANGAFIVRPYRIVVACPAIVLTPPILAIGETGTPYDETITATGGTGPYTFTVIGDLPDGLTPTFTDTAVRIAGTPTVTGSFPFTIEVHDRYGCTGTRPYEIKIVAAGPPVLVPTLSEWMLALFSILLAAAGIAVIRRGG
jgi:hypothetical protein